MYRNLYLYRRRLAGILYVRRHLGGVRLFHVDLACYGIYITTNVYIWNGNREKDEKNGPQMVPKPILEVGKISYKLLFYKVLPKWRNWQTRGIQNPVLATGCGFDSHLRQ